MTDADTPKLPEPRDFLDPELTPLATWTLQDLSAALGNRTVAQLWGTNPNNARQARWRKRTSVERMQVLQDAVRKNEPLYREALTTIYTTGAFRGRA